mgnify:CR=1 FL=1
MTERMGVLSSDGRCLQPSPLAARAMLRPAARRLAAVGIGFAGGWAVLYGALMPFGLGLTLGLAEDCFAPCAAGAALGLLLHGLGALSLRSLCQLCALGAAVAARWLLPQKFVPAALAGCGTLTGMALCFALGSSGADLLLYSAADALLAAGIGFGLRKFAPERPGMGTLLVGAAVAAALGSVRWGWFSPGVLACAAAELALCCRAQKFAALSGSAVLGAALCAADPALAPAAAGLGCATAAAAVLAPGRRVETLAAYAGCSACSRPETPLGCCSAPAAAWRWSVCCPAAGLSRWQTPRKAGKTPPRPPAVRRHLPGWKPWRRAFPHWRRR